jgi:integrase
VPGLGVRVHPSGKRIYVFQYRTKARQQRRMAIGQHGPFTIDKAREAAGDLYQAVRKGRDPADEEKTAARRAPDRIESKVDEFMQRYMAGKKRAQSYITDTHATFENHVLPRWRGREIKTITRRDVIELLDAIVDAGKPIAANRTLAAVRKLFNWALQRGIIDASPVALVEMPGAERKRERILAPDEIRAVWTGASGLGYPFGSFFHMALATGQRREEIARMRWADIDTDERTWTLSSAMTKAGRAHVVPLSPLALEILDGAKELTRLLRGEPENGTATSSQPAAIDRSAATARQRPGSIRRLRRRGTGTGCRPSNRGRSTTCAGLSGPA